MRATHSHWRPIGIATLSHGYGCRHPRCNWRMPTSTIGAGGVKRPLFSPLRSAFPAVASESSAQSQVAHALSDSWSGWSKGGNRDSRLAHSGIRVSERRGTAFKIDRRGYFEPT